MDMAELGYRLEDRPGKPSAWKRDDGAAEEAAKRTEEAVARAAAEGAVKRDKKEQTLKLKQTVRRRPGSCCERWILPHTTSKVFCASCNQKLEGSQLKFDHHWRFAVRQLPPGLCHPSNPF